MKQYQIRTYQKEDFALWNNFILEAKNATFLFNRNFMEYHSDRFDDYSLMVFDGQKLVAVLPANRVGNTVYSHQGLSYGSLVVRTDSRIKEYILLFKEVIKFLNETGIDVLEIKILPKIYNRTIADEIDYVVFLMDSDCFRADVYLTMDSEINYMPNRNRKRALKIARGLNIEIREENDFDSFWNQILIPNLKERFGIEPVHSVTEIKKLALLFPNEIKLFNAYQNGVLKAGVVLFLTEKVAHFQYSSGGNDRNENAALDMLFDTLIQKYSSKKYVSFGSSSENNGLKLNEGLAYWKESFGATTTVQSFLRFNTSNYFKLESI